LDERVGLGARREFAAQGCFFRRGKGTRSFRPVPPGTAAEMVLQRRKETVAVQPRGVLFAKGRKISVGQRTLRVATPRGVRSEQERQLAFVQRAKIDLVAIERAQRRDFGLREQTSAHEGRRINKVRIAGKG
jgi:hypothetical protein